jgi:hypothetical protein
MHVQSPAVTIERKSQITAAFLVQPCARRMTLYSLANISSHNKIIDNSISYLQS